ncbi:MAG: alpha/beta hydrolase [Betaproteobacteria bacterium]
MNAHTKRRLLAGPSGSLEVALDVPPGPAQGKGLALICHPHPLHGGTMDNKVVQTLARAFLQLGWRSLRLNYRGVGQSEGGWDEGRGETDDAQHALLAVAEPAEPLLLAGFSFGGFVAAQLAQRLAQAGRPATRLVLVGPATGNFALPPVAPDTLVVHGEADEVVPLQCTLDWARAQALPVTVLPGVGHFFHGQLPLLKSVVLRALDPAATVQAH